VSGNTYTISNVIAPHAVGATFSVSQFTLTVAKSGTGGGDVTADTGFLVWIGPTGMASYNYNASVNLTALADTSSAFTGWSGDYTGTQTSVTITMDGSKNITANFTHIPSSCSYTLSSGGRSFTLPGGTGSVPITTSRADCPWSASSSAAWITITSGSSGTGDGTVNYTVAANDTGFSRNGTITVDGQTYTVTQSASSASASPVYRFYNTASGTHFYTILENEKDLVIQTMPTFIYEGPKFYANQP
jgi:uncharacterized repeat protein (TIGR02543 family)